MINRQFFFNAVRNSLFSGSMNTGQVAGIEAILDEWDRRKLTDLRWLAYMLATAYHEVAKTMQPIREFGLGKGKAYGKAIDGKVYYGRGLVQLTWRENYQKMSDYVGVDLVSDPDRALDLNIAVGILFEGMIRGTFTGKKLADYFTGEKADWEGARRIVNGIDKATMIAGYAKTFFIALNAAADIDPVPAPSPTPPPTTHTKGIGWRIAIFVVLAIAAGGVVWWVNHQPATTPPTIQEQVHDR